MNYFSELNYLSIEVYLGGLYNISTRIFRSTFSSHRDTLFKFIVHLGLVEAIGCVVVRTYLGKKYNKTSFVSQCSAASIF